MCKHQIAQTELPFFAVACKPGHSCNINRSALGIARGCVDASRRCRVAIVDCKGPRTVYKQNKACHNLFSETAVVEVFFPAQDYPYGFRRLSPAAVVADYLRALNRPIFGIKGALLWCRNVQIMRLRLCGLTRRRGDCSASEKGESPSP
ncbi:hypothetical protein EVAR_52610_1 [Eumeta japonica]|uniref:Uncharacterized protein n=1 Tax=Eumeta variegata TaxID=151549 RepID=A0A4C1YKI5_EUMVA|nr:hypothetical protein EVAR_52610_1 [Eumeta japonica]